VRLILERSGIEYHKATLGTLYSRESNLHLFMLERAWDDNKPFVSCVPGGLYELEPHTGKGGTWALVGDTVSHWEDEEHARFCCLFHPANYAHQILGCLAPGLSAVYVDPDADFPQIMVGRSGDAMGILKRALGVGSLGHTLEIIDP